MVQYVYIPAGWYCSKGALAQEIKRTSRAIRWAVQSGQLEEIKITVGEGDRGRVRLIPKDSAEKFLASRRNENECTC